MNDLRTNFLSRAATMDAFAAQIEQKIERMAREVLELRASASRLRTRVAIYDGVGAPTLPPHHEGRST